MVGKQTKARRPRHTMNKTLTPAPIDEKNIITDFVQDDLFRGDYLTTPDNKNRLNDLIGFYGGSLLEAKWATGSSTMAFRFIDLPECSVKDNDRAALIAYLNELSKENEGLYVKVWESGGWILCSFYFKEE